jgi:O-succinylbenzoic acid--CoA ligase
MPVHHIAGLMVLVRSWVHGNPFEIDPSVGGARPFSAATFAATTQLAIRASAVDGLPLMVSLVPTQIARLLDAGSVGIEALRAYSVVLSGAAATPQPMLDALRSHGIAVVVSYGMSETCGGCVFDGLALSGVNISLSTKDAADPGRISISGLTLASGYRLRPDLDAVSFIDSALQTHDVGRLDQAGLLHVLGRLDDVIMVGGVSVALGAVESIIRHHPDISDVAVVDVVDDLWGALPIAYVVTSNTSVDQVKLSEQIKSAVAQQIGRAGTPRSIAYVNQLPMLDSGKVDRLSLRLQAASDIAQGRLDHPGMVQ